MGGPNKFLTGLKRPERYILDTTKLKNSFSLIFNTAFDEVIFIGLYIFNQPVLILDIL